MPVTRSVHDAAEIWAGNVFGAPREFAALITSIEVRDEVLERVVTEVVRRDIREQRLPSNRRDLTPPRINPNSVDPFEISVAALRAQSEYVAPCGYCRGAGVCTCPSCAGGGRAACSSCGGSGKQRSAKTGRPINCKACRATGTMRCGRCDAAGSVTCTVCSGSGHQLVWLTYEQEARWMVAIVPESPVARAHAQLTELRFLAPSEVDAFSILVMEEASGPVILQGYRDTDNPLLRSVAASIDSRLERINHQQYYRLAVVRRDATYGMCGTTGTLVLSGKNLTGATTPRAVRPIQLRLYAWAAIAAALAAGATVLCARLRGSSEYFNSTNPIITAFGLLAVGVAMPALGGLLRALQPAFKLSRIRPFERHLAFAAAATFGSMIIIGLLVRPRFSEVEKALSAGDLRRARAVVAALRETNGATVEVADAEDSVSLAEAKTQSGDARLQTLDAVVARHGKRAPEASTAARTERLSEIRALIASKTSAPAIGAIDRWFGGSWKGDPEIAEERARAEDVAGSLCTEGPCRVQAATLAQLATPTAERAQRATEARSKLLDALTPAEVPGEEPVVRLKRLRALSATSNRTLEIAGTDPELGESAKKASAWAAAERGKVPMLGADLPVVEELLEASASLDVRGPVITVEGTRAFLVLDAQKKCRGVYAVGEKEGARAIRGTTWTADRLLSQAIGRTATVKRPNPESSTTSRWFEVSAQVTARWKNGDVIELRIGDATP